MKELTPTEMEYISGAGIIDLPFALIDFTVKSALGLISAGFQSGYAGAFAAMETTFDIVSNLISGSPNSLGSILTDHVNSFIYAETGIWSNFVYNAATNWGSVTYSLQK